MQQTTAFPAAFAAATGTEGREPDGLLDEHFSFSPFAPVLLFVLITVPPMALL